MNNPDIIIRRADKSNIYVILDRDQYIDKLNSILNDQTKFQQIRRDPTEQLKTKVNKLIEANNAVINHHHINKIIGEYSPGYLYGNIKTHKPNNPVRPIISQVTTPTYHLAKQLNQIITPYLPSKYMLKSSDEFIDILQTTRPEGLIASLDVESLFTNVPVEHTIDIICNNVYANNSIPPPNIPRPILEKLLRACTCEAPFKTPDGRLYLQTDGVAMGSPLGVTFANFYMCDVENRVLLNQDNIPKIYCRYVDDIFVVVRDEAHLIHIKTEMERHSVLNFTYELSVNNKIPFLDIVVEGQTDKYVTSVYRKPTDAGRCLNAASECPERYKQSVVRSYLRRAYKTSSNWTVFHQEVVRIKQILVNNGYTNSFLDREVNFFLNKYLQNSDERETHATSIKLYYCNQMNGAYKTDERVIRDIIKSKVKCINDDDKLDLVIYYKNKKVSNLLMKNNLTQDPSPLKQTNVIYNFNCNIDDCALLPNVNYIRMTRTTLSRRLTMHLQNGNIKDHMRDAHNRIITREQLVGNTKILRHCSDTHRLLAYEALTILENNPAINTQSTGIHKTLLLFGSNPPPQNTFNHHHTIPNRQAARPLTLHPTSSS